MMDDVDANLLAETENFMIWEAENDGENIVHIELGGVSLHLSDDEWDELVTLIKIAME